MLFRPLHWLPETNSIKNINNPAFFYFAAPFGAPLYTEANFAISVNVEIKTFSFSSSYSSRMVPCQRLVNKERKMPRRRKLSSALRALKRFRERFK